MGFMSVTWSEDLVLDHDVCSTLTPFSPACSPYKSLLRIGTCSGGTEGAEDDFSFIASSVLPVTRSGPECLGPPWVLGVGPAVAEGLFGVLCPAKYLCQISGWSSSGYFRTRPPVMKRQEEPKKESRRISATMVTVTSIVQMDRQRPVASLEAKEHFL